MTELAAETEQNDPHEYVELMLDIEDGQVIGCEILWRGPPSRAVDRTGVLYARCGRCMAAWHGSNRAQGKTGAWQAIAVLSRN
jgi:hypothetical protein